MKEGMRSFSHNEVPVIDNAGTDSRKSIVEREAESARKKSEAPIRTALAILNESGQLTKEFKEKMLEFAKAKGNQASEQAFNRNVEKKRVEVTPEEIADKVDFYSEQIIKNGEVDEAILFSSFRDILSLFTDLNEQDVDYVMDLDLGPKYETYGYDHWNKASLRSLLSQILKRGGGKEKVIEMIKSIKYNLDYIDRFCEKLKAV